MQVKISNIRETLDKYNATPEPYKHLVDNCHDCDGILEYTRVYSIYSYLSDVVTFADSATLTLPEEIRAYKWLYILANTTERDISSKIILEIKGEVKEDTRYEHKRRKYLDNYLERNFKYSMDYRTCNVGTLSSYLELEKHIKYLNSSHEAYRDLRVRAYKVYAFKDLSYRGTYKEWLNIGDLK